jgi:hypothetical protein
VKYKEKVELKLLAAKEYEEDPTALAFLPAA